MLFEEAAGVSHYKQRRAETLRRLEETTHNLERVQDILSEIRPRMNALKRQANRARNHEQLAADLRHLLQIWYGYRWEQVKKNLRIARNESEEARQSWMDSRDAQLALQERLEASRNKLNALQEKQRTLQQERDETRERFEAVRREVAVLSERKALLKRQLDDHADELPALKAQRQAAAEQLEQALADLALAQTELDGQAEQLRTFEASFLSQQGEIQRWQQNAGELESERRQAADALAQAKGRVAQLASQLRERLADTGDGFDLSAAEKDVQRLSDQLKSAQKEHAEAIDKLAARGKERRAVQQSLDAIRSDRDRLASDIVSLEQQIAVTEIRLEQLNNPGAGEGQIPPDAPVLGQLAARLLIPDQYQTAARAALADRYLTWLLANEDDIWRLLNTREEGRILAIVADKSSAVLERHDGDRPVPPDESIVVGWADELISAEEPYLSLVHRLLSRTLIVHAASDALQVARWLPPGHQAVSLDGFVAHADGIVEIGAESVGAVRSARLREAAQVGEDLDRLLSRLVTLKQRQSDADSRITTLKASLSEATGDCESLERKVRTASSAVSQAQSAHSLAQQKLEFESSSAQRQRRSIERLEGQLSEEKATVVEFQGAVAKISDSLDEAKTRLSGLPVAESAEARKQLRQNLQSAQTILAGRKAVVDSRQTTLNQVTEQLHRRQARYDDLQHRWQASELNSKQQELDALKREMAAFQQELDPLATQIAESRREVTRLSDSVTEVQRSSHDAETRYTQARIELTQKESAMDNLKDRIQADLGIVAFTYDDDEPAQSPLPMAEIVEQLPVVDKLPEDIEESIQTYRGQLNRMGAINPEAPAEYEETATRYEFLTQQTEDLTTTKERLRDVIDDLDDLTSRAFADTVDKVNDVFGEVFERLFGGGSAQLALTDPDDLTISGVDIMARLPRRREQGLALLSGGERSLTAAALIFALLKVSPTPFCVLDEVDAMLDEANINRFRELLKELRAQTQFIVITHNRGTVQVAESVYGVSMGADSTSQVISIKPEEYVRQQV
jgi:chromosome segregation protein